MKNRTKRLAHIITLLSKGLHVNTPNISKELRVTQKIIQTDFNNFLLPYFSDIYYDYSGKYYKCSKSLLSSTLFSAYELAIICILKAKSRDKYSDEDFSLHVEGLFDKFEGLLSHEIYSVSSLEKIDDFRDEIVLVKYAIKHKQEIECIYRDKKRTLQPLKILNFDDFWYLVNYDTQYNDIRKYHLNSIKNIELLNSHFEVNENSLRKFDNAINAWFKPEVEPYMVVLHVNRAIAKYFERKPISKTQRILNTYKDGSIEIELFITDDMEIIPTIQRYLPNIKVVEPNSLFEKIKKNLSAT
jgi:predicted DNA-binding transcriptional regulator YafY